MEPSDYRNPSAPLERLQTPSAAHAAWVHSVMGRHALAWEQGELDRLVADVFGYHAVQLGLAGIEGLRANRMPSRWLMLDEDFEQASAARTAWQGSADSVLRADFHALPFPASSLDLVVLPHTLEMTPDPHLTLREVERVLRPEGRVVLAGFNPASLWGLSERQSRLAFWRRQTADTLGGTGNWVGYWRLRDWLRLLSFEVEGGRFGCYIPPVRSERWRERLGWLEPLGDRWWPVLGSVYILIAVKRVRGMRLVGLSRSRRRVQAAAPAVVTQRHPRSWPPSEDAR